MQHYGVDLSSNNQHPLNYAAIVAYLRQLGGGLQPFVIIKINEGTGYVNPFESVDVQGFLAAGAAVAGYLMDHGSAAVGAEEQVYKRVSGTLPQTDDIELPDGLGARDYATHTAQLIAQNPAALVYLNQSMAAEGFPTGAGLWLACYNNRPGATPFPVTIHQYTSSAAIPGCAGVFDLNVWCGSEERFANFFQGAPMPTPPAPPVQAPHGTGIARTKDGGGYWLVSSDGHVKPHGNAAAHGDLANNKPATDIVGICPTPSGNGYWLVAAGGGIFSFGDAKFCGSAANEHPATPVVGMTCTPTGEGYWLLAAGGGVFSFGDAKFFGAGL